MIRSMTGFGESEREAPGGRIQVQIKTVNHRHFNAHVKSPPGFEHFDHHVQSWLREAIQRGHVSVSIGWARDPSLPDRPLPEFDVERARAFKALLSEGSDATHFSKPIEFETVLRYGDVLRTPDIDRTPAFEAELLRECVAGAVSAVVALREAEGARLADDLRGRMTAIGEALDRIAERAPQRLEAERDRLREAVRELAEADAVDEERLAREIAYIAEKWDIHEEIVRFRSHLELFAEALDGPVADPVGKRLGFLVQEMHREANTIGSKANDAPIVHRVIEIKEEIERLREQVENVE